MVTPSELLSAMSQNGLLCLGMLLICGSIFVNGSTDAANAIAEAVGTRSITFRNAVILGVVCNFAGLVLMTMASTAVADTISNMVDFGGDSHAAFIAIVAALVGIVVWGVAAWCFGIPTSESHALIAGLSGAAIAVQGGISGINFSEWAKVLYGLVFSTILGFVLGYALCKLLRFIFCNATPRQANKVFDYLQVIGAGFGAFMHGAQDGQKFMSTAVMVITLGTVGHMEGNLTYPLWIMVLCAGVMSVGTAVGGKKIIKTVGTQMVKMEKYQGASASLSAGVSLLLSSLTGLPVSTTHTKTAAIMGAGASKSKHAVNWRIALEMVYTWIFTFPGCGLIGFILAKVFLAVF
ncbi:MAG: inorganic phosphate transporter [Coriobacteriales bacterium]|nr:inorganic phosphate transporter [Coriobacteriales bacterium]